MNKNMIITALLIVAGLYGGSLIKGCQDTKELKNLNEALDAELLTWKDKDGLNNAKIIAFEAKDADTFLDLETKDSLIIELQKEVKDAKINKGGSVTIIEGETKFDTVFVSTDSKVYKRLFNNYINGSVSNEWITSDFGIKLDSLTPTTFKVDSTRFSLSVKNKYIVILGREKGKAFAMVKNLNPYSSTTAIRAFQTTGKGPPKLTVGAFFGPGVLLSKEPKAGLVLGAGVNYKF